MTSPEIPEHPTEPFDGTWMSDEQVKSLNRVQFMWADLTEAQTLLTSQAPSVFVFHGLGGYLMWPYVQGPTLAKNYLGYDGIQWPGFYPHSTNQQGLYIAKNVGSYPRQSESGL